MHRLHMCLICHTEGLPNSFKSGVPAMLRIREEVEQKSGKPFPLTWALGTFHANPQPPVFYEYADVFLDKLERGDEIGLHPHGIIKNGRWDVDNFIREDTRQFCTAGFPPPKTFVAGVWAFYPSTLQIIEELGYEVDASVVAGPTRQKAADKEGNIFYDYPPSKALADSEPLFVPYRLSSQSVVTPGHSSVIEIPVSGGLEEFRSVGDDTNIKRYEARYQRLEKTGLEVHEIFWHPWELLMDFGSTDVEAKTVKTFKDFLLRVASDPVVKFSTVQFAASDWARHNTSH